MGRKRTKKEVIQDKEAVQTTTTVRPNKKLKSSAKFKCNECDEEFETSEAADKHILKEHYGLVSRLIRYPRSNIQDIQDPRYHIFLLFMSKQLIIVFYLNLRPELTMTPKLRLPTMR